MSRPRRGVSVMFAMLAVAWGLAPALATADSTVEYIHTDLLGNIAVVTDATANVTERREYEPYGAQLTPMLQDGPGYTGHVQDAATGLVYMQQRYYDPEIGGFLSEDPVTAYSNPVAGFSRYRYANNNPYNFIDPDGRLAMGNTCSRLGSASCSGSYAKNSIEANWSIDKRLDEADRLINNVSMQLANRPEGNRFNSFDDAAKFFAKRFARRGEFLQLEFGATSMPHLHNIRDISRSSYPGDFDGKVGAYPGLANVPAGGADFHTHPYSRDVRFSRGDLGGAIGTDAKYSYVFSASSGKRLDVESAKTDKVSPYSSRIYEYIIGISIDD